MELTVLTEEEFRSFRDTSPYRTFMQTPEIGKLRTKSGWQVTYLGLKKELNIVAATMLLSKKRYFGKSEFYALRGPLLDFEDLALFRTFLQLLKKYVKDHNGYCLRMDPYLVYKQRDSSGALVSNGVDHSDNVAVLNKLGFKAVPLAEQEQVSWMYVLDIENKTEDEIMKNLRPNTRNTIRKTLKNGIEIEELALEDLPKFYQIMEETGKRKQFAIRDLAYFEHMYELFSPRHEIKYLITKLNLKKHIALLQKEKEEVVQEKEKLSPAKYNDGKRKSLDSTIEGFNKRMKQAEQLQQEYGEEIILSGSMFMLCQPEIIYLSSGNYEQFMMYNSQYLIQWEMIKYGIEHGFKRYNFYGIPSTFDKNDKDYGIYEFKTGFNGYVEQLIGEYVVATSPLYYLVRLVHKLKKK